MGARRTQAERTAETTRRLLEAAADCLIERGYAGTTTTEVCRRAGVSRGALLHHYPTKDELVAAAVVHVVDLRVEEFHATVSALPADTDVVSRLETAIDVVWGICRGPTVAAWIDLVVAARTDPALRRHVELVELRLDEAIAQTWAELFPPDDALPPGFYQVAPPFLFALLHGLALEQMTGSPETDRRAEFVIFTLKLIVRTLATADLDQIVRELDSLTGGAP